MLITFQLANALNHLKAARIIHADLKLENVMLVNQQLEPYRVKVIDFGLATSVRFAKVGAYIQTRPFRWVTGAINPVLDMGHTSPMVCL